MNIEHPLSKYINYELIFDWPKISREHPLSLDFVKKYEKYLHFNLIPYNPTLTGELVKKYRNILNISFCLRMAPNIVDILGCLEPQDISYYDISYYDICLNPYITLEIINKYTEDILWDVLSCNNSLSPLIIDKFKDKLNWNFVCRYNKYINENFIEKHDERIVFSELSRNHWLSRELVNKYNHRVSILDWLRIQIFG